MPSPHYPTLSVKKSLLKLGEDIRNARMRRGLPADVVAKRAFITRPTLSKIEKGAPGVGMGIYASVLQSLGLLDGLSDLASPESDVVGVELSLESLPKRARLSKLRR